MSSLLHFSSPCTHSHSPSSCYLPHLPSFQLFYLSKFITDYYIFSRPYTIDSSAPVCISLFRCWILLHGRILVVGYPWISRTKGQYILIVNFIDSAMHEIDSETRGSRKVGTTDWLGGIFSVMLAGLFAAMNADVLRWPDLTIHFLFR